MELDFDKEIDALLRQTAQGESVFVSENPKSKIQNPKPFHLDADEVSAFAENALPEKTKSRYTAHFADCETCRKNLSNLILLNAEQKTETVHVEERKIISSPIPWYRKLFAVPNLAYTLGALILGFSAIAAWTILQSSNNFQNAEVSQISERQPSGKGMSSDGEVAPAEEIYNNAMSANTAAMNSGSMNLISNSSTSVSNSATFSAPVAAANSNVAVRQESDKDFSVKPTPAALQKEPSDSAKTDDSVAAGAPLKENNSQTENEAAKQQQPNQTQNSIAQNQTNIAPDSQNVRRAPSATLRDENKKLKVEESRNDAREKSNETTTVGGKTFKRTNNAWYDSAYKGQPTTNITRGTKEYKKLDSGLRGIAENLGGTVIIVWKEKAYRIQ